MEFDAAPTSATLDAPAALPKPLVGANGDSSALLRTYDPNAFSHGRLKCLQRCPRSYYIEYERGMERIHGDRKGLRMGGAFSMALEHNNPELVYSNCYADHIDKATTIERTEELQIECALVQWYAAKYIEIYGVAKMREVEYQFPLGDTGFTFRSAADGLDAQSGELVVIEDKLLGRWDETKEANVFLDPQPTSELWGINSLGLHFPNSGPVKASKVLYRVTLKPRIIRRKGRGNAKTGAESWSEFVSRCIETVEADLSEYFLEITIPKTDDELQEWYLETIDWVENLKGHRERGRYPKSKDTCSYSGGCAHREVCSGIASAGSLYQLKQGYPTT